MLDTLNTLISKFSAGDLSGAQAATSQLSSVLSHVTSQRASLDSSLQGLQAAGSYAQSEKVQLITAQTNLMQADVPAVATGLSLVESQRTALESVITAIEKQATLFNLLQ